MSDSSEMASADSHRRALERFTEFLLERFSGKDVDFAELCAEHPELEGALHAVFTAQGVREVLKRAMGGRAAPSTSRIDPSEVVSSPRPS